jgi:hypothetical protein
MAVRFKDFTQKWFFYKCSKHFERCKFFFGSIEQGILLTVNFAETIKKAVNFFFFGGLMAC